MGFTHIELLPITEHPLDASWGYQPIGLFAPTARFGEPAGFARFVDRAHAAGLGVILDWVPAHFPTDEHGLARFDGTALYEHADPRQGFHPDWNTAIYNFGRTEVANFLYRNALYWVERFHIDGLRVDAVASMLYLDYSRKAGEWLPNERRRQREPRGGRLPAARQRARLRRLSGRVTIAEESTAWPGVSRPTDQGGLGFGFKWNMGWMHDTLDYMRSDPIHRRWHHNEMTFGLLYAFSENFVLPLSHDEVVHGKGSLIGKMPGDDWQKFANLRAYYGFMWGYPGKKLLFMGQEFAQTQRVERRPSRSTGGCWTIGRTRACRRWSATSTSSIARRPRCTRATASPRASAGSWSTTTSQSVFACLRQGARERSAGRGRLQFHAGAARGLPARPAATRALARSLNSDAGSYGGSDMGNLGGVTAEAQPAHGFPASATLTLPPLATMFLVFSPNSA